MSEEPQVNNFEIKGVNTSDRTNAKGEKVQVRFVRYRLDKKKTGVLQILAGEHTLEELEKLARLDQERMIKDREDFLGELK